MWTPWLKNSVSNRKPQKTPRPLLCHPSEGNAPAPAAGDELHIPVFLDEILEFFAIEPGQWIIDGTLGLGGHSERFLKAGATVVGVDQDNEALAHASDRLQAYPNFHPLHTNASELASRLKTLEPFPGLADAILFDLGTSSWQLDQADRGFSFQHDGPLDMRMNQEESITAADLVNNTEESELADLIWTYGEERASRAIARTLCRRRDEKAFERTLDLAEVVSKCVRRSGRIHPATRTFQALRIAVNRELEVLPAMLEQATQLLKPGGKLAVISFHSLEDRIVKRFLRLHAQATLDDPTWPEPRPNPDHHFASTRKIVHPSPTESTRNPRSRSAKLRLAVHR